jgi:hypothetical protein
MRLERDGFVVRIVERTRDRVTHVRPTLEGLRHILQNTHGARPEAVATGLRRTRWGHALADGLGSVAKTSAPTLANGAAEVDR